MSKLYIGTSGVTLPVPQSQYPDAFKGKSRLAYYSTMLNSLEVNSTFYKNPRPATVERWTAEVSVDFSFTFKLPKVVSHAKQLAFEEDNLETFFAAIASAKAQTKCLLLQLPPSTDASNKAPLKKLLKAIRKYTMVDIAVEFRHESWYVQVIYDLLHLYNMTVVMHDYKKGKFDKLLDQPFYYYRFHGIDSNYRGSYPDDVLQQYARQLISCVRENKEVYCYFNNTMGEAYSNAQRLWKLVTR